jgi:hypothetical protein
VVCDVANGFKPFSLGGKQGKCLACWEREAFQDLGQCGGCVFSLLCLMSVVPETWGHSMVRVPKTWHLEGGGAMGTPLGQYFT